MGAFLRFIVEYVGNLHLPTREDQPPPKSPADRRTNRHARDLMDWVKGQMEARGLPTAKKRELVRDLRHAFRPGGPTSGAISAADGTSEGDPEWVPGTKGVSRDAPS
jgi:hypothetical protein